MIEEPLEVSMSGLLFGDHDSLLEKSLRDKHKMGCFPGRVGTRTLPD